MLKVHFPVLIFLLVRFWSLPILPLKMKKKATKTRKDCEKAQVFTSTSACLWFMTFTIVQEIKACTVQPHFAKIKQEGLTLIALQVCCY
jgi:hypothetical protein